MNKDQIYHLESEFIRVSVTKQGAGLLSIFDLESYVEYLWQGHPTLNPWKPQLIFPIVGKLKDDQYWLGRKYYHMQKDGFLKDFQFEVKNQRRDRITFVHTNNQDTELIFPFRYSIEVTYMVYGPKLTVSFVIKNLDKKEMFFSLGFAPTFNVPLGPEGHEDCFIEFSTQEERGAYFLENDLVNFHDADNKKVVQDCRVFFTQDNFRGGEMVFKDIKSKSVALKNILNEKSVNIDLGNIPYLSIWTYPGANFVRIAPAFGVTDALDSNNDFYTKEGLIDLEQEKTFKHEFVFHIR
ncbi:hypothetical protein ACRXCV_02855 [Halobacteriovorax sp. GFR7]|uniref:aldose epimerase family protein n=1 Tax=unclassified Halobacteriovorax TaxID=2639665 RepID=UPI003713407B